jgi:hypothetical protein
MSIIIQTDLALIFNNDADPGYSPEAGTTYTGFQREGAGCQGFQVSNELIETWATTPATLDMSLGSGKAIFGWIVSYGQLDTYALGGLGIILGDGTNQVAFYTGGKDRIPFQAAGWQCHVLDSGKMPGLYNEINGTLAALNLSAITQVGYRFKTLAKSLGGADNCFTDIIRYGTGLTLSGGTSASPATFASAALEDLSTDAGKAFGIIREIQPGIYGAQGRIDLGDPGTGSSWFQDQDSLLVWEDWGQGDILYSSTIFGNADGTNVVQLGQKIGTGDTALGSNGCTFQSSGPQVRISWTGSDSYLTGSNFIDIYGTKFFKLKSDEYLQFNDSGSDFIGNLIDQCSQVIIGGTYARNCTFSGVVSATTSSYASASLLWTGSVDIKYCAFNNNAIIGTNPPNVNAGIQIPNEDNLIEVTFDNLTFSGNDYDVLSQYTGTLTINATDSNVSSYTASADSPADVSIINNVFLTVNVQDEDAISIESASVWIATNDTAETVLMNEYTDGSGQAIENYNYLGDQDIQVRVRKSSPGDTRYNNFKTVGLIDDAGFTLSVILIEDGNVT